MPQRALQPVFQPSSALGALAGRSNAFDPWAPYQDPGESDPAHYGTAAERELYKAGVAAQTEDLQSRVPHIVTGPRGFDGQTQDFMWGPEDEARTQQDLTMRSGAATADAIDQQYSGGALERRARNQQRVQPIVDATGDMASEAAAGRAFLPEASALRANQQQDLLERIKQQYQIPAEARADSAEAVASTRAQGAIGAAQARAKSADDRAASIVEAFINRGTTDERTHKLRPFTPDEIGQIRQHPEILYGPGGAPGGGAPGGGGLDPQIEAAVNTAVQQGRFKDRASALADLQQRHPEFFVR